MASTGTYHLLSSVVRLANAKIPPHHKLHSITSLLLECLEASSAAFFLYNHEKRSFTSKISAALASPVSVPCSIRVGDGVCGRCIEENTLITSDSSCCHPDEKLPSPAKFVCALPVVEDGARYGVVLLGFPARKDIKPIDAELQDVLVEVAGVVRAIRVAELSDRRVKNINTLNALAHVLNHSFPSDELIPRIIDACHVSSGSWGTVLRLVPESNEAETFAKFVVPCGDITKMLLDMEEECSERVASNGMSILMTDLIAEQDIPPSLVCVPLPFEGAVKGTLTFFGRIAEEGGYYNFDEEDRDLFENMGMLIANAIEGAKHYQKMVALSTDNEKKVKELTLLYRISNIMLSTVKLNKLVTITLSSLTSVLAPSFDRAMLFLINDKSRVVQGMLGITAQAVAEVVDPESSEFELTERMSEISDDQVRRLQDSEFCRKVRATRLSLDQRPSVCADAVANRGLLLCEGDGVDADLQAALGVSSCAIAPLVAKEQVIGIIVVDNALTGRLIAEDELRFLQLLTNQAGMAIENSMLYSRLKEANKELYETQERLIQGERLAAIGEMAAGIAHELKTPLISIGGFARRLARKTSPGSDEQQSAETIIREVDRLEKMLTDILSFSRKTTICYSSFNIGEVIDETLNLIAGSLEENDIAIIREIDYASANLLADRQQLKQVFLNLIFNAQEAMKGGGTLNISVGKTLVDDEIPAVKIRIRDTGGGIPLEILNNIFNPFFTTKATGTGLGLPIVNRIITNHLGRIDVINHPPVGAEFVIVLPLHP